MPHTRQPAAVVGAPARRALLGGVLGAGLALGLGGCGFRLRGAQTLPFQRMRTNLSEQTALGRTLRAQLQASGVQLVGDAPVRPGQRPEPVDVVLQVLIDRRERAVVGQTAAGQVRELQLRQRFTFRVGTPLGQELIAETELLEERDLSFSENLVLGKEAEEALLYRDMEQNIARQLLYRLAALKGL